MYPVTGEVSYQYLLSIRIQCSILTKLSNFSLLHEPMYNYKKTQESAYDPTKFAIYSLLRPEIEFISNCFRIFQKTVSFDDIVHFIDEESIVTYVHFDCDFTFYYEAPIKVRQTNGEQKNISTSCKKNPSASQVTISVTVLLIKSIPVTSFWTRKIYGTWIQQLLNHPITLMIAILRPISTLKQQHTPT